MAIDEALLVIGGPPTIRLYGWSPPGLSIGYFQQAAAFREMGGDHVLVRRPTGGGAILHQDELTFALTLESSLLPRSTGDSYRLIHSSIAAALGRVGITVAACSTEQDSPVSPGGSPWCFARPGSLDLVDRDSRKVLGSAQRRIRRPHPRTLNHGSLVIRPGTASPHLGEHLASEIATALGLHPRDGELTSTELGLARELVEVKYGNPAFTHAR